MDISFLLGSSVVAVLCVQVMKDLFGKLEGRFGSLMTQVILLAVAFGVAGVGMAMQKLPPEIINTTYLVFTSAITIYEIFWKAIYSKAIKNK